jgi:NAD-dependent deacetylase
MPFELDRIFQALEQCDWFISIGTSGQVYPAAGFVNRVPNKARKTEINAEPSMMSSYFDDHRLGLASAEVPRFLAEL